MQSSDHTTRDLADLLELVMDQIVDGVLIVNDDNRKVAFCNKKFVSMWKIPIDIVERGSDQEMIDHVTKQLRDPCQFIKSIQGVQNSDQSFNDELEFTDGTIFSRKSISINSINSSRYRTWIFSDITHQKKFNIDSLTGCLNRQCWDSILTLDSPVYSNTSYCIIVINLNDFNVVNNELGHEAGDQVLVRLGETLRRVFCNERDKVFRVGGDEFCALIESKLDISSDIHKQLAKQLIAAGLNASIGVCMSSPDYEIIETYRRADQRMLYSKKREKEKQTANHPALPSIKRLTNTDEEICMLADLSVALKRGELYLVFQPIYDQFNQIQWMEVFCRWSVDNKEIPPSIFIPLSEQCDLIHRIWDFVLTKTVKTIAEWLNAGLNVKPVSLNFSAIQVKYYKNTGFSYAEQIKIICEEYGVSPSLLKIELTETSLLEDLSKAKELFDQLTNLGVALCIDDYGTGFSSLSIIQALPIKYLKIDGMFISDIPANPENTAIAKGTISMANELGLEVCAECVQNSAQIQFLAEQGCKYFQGFYQCPPVSALDMSRML